MQRTRLHECVGQLQANGLNRCTLIENPLDADGRAIEKFDAHGRALFKAHADTGESVAVHTYQLDAKGTCGHDMEGLLRACYLCHPHIVAVKSALRTPDFLCIVTERANEGDLFRMVRRGGGHGLPVPAARFIFQQLILALQFCQDQGIYVRNLPASQLLLFEDDSGRQTVKLSHRLVANSRGPPQTPVVATMCMCPHMIRQAGFSGAVWEDLAPVCGVWSAAVTFYFSLTARWPFSKEQMAAWASTPVESWQDDAAALAGLAAAGVPADSGVYRLIQEVFACGHLRPSEFRRVCPSVSDIMARPCFQVDLPADAQEMAATSTRRTHQWCASEPFLALKDTLQSVTGPPAQQKRAALPRSGSVPSAATPPRDGFEERSRSSGGRGGQCMPQPPAAAQAASGGRAVLDSVVPQLNRLILAFASIMGQPASAFEGAASAPAFPESCGPCMGGAAAPASDQAVARQLSSLDLDSFET